jgi:pimeloyl-ACP methyl ester carboxylesterase
MRIHRITGFVLFFLLSGCTGKDLYRIAIDSGRRHCNLTKQTIPVGEHLKMAYLVNLLPRGHTLVLVHGFGVQKEVWLPFVSALQGRYRLVIPDLIGDGESSRPERLDYSIEAQARRIHALVEKLHVPHPVLVGNSMGGAIALAYAARYPTEGLVLIDPLGFEVERSYLQKLGISKAKEVFLHMCRREDVERFVRMVYDRPPYIPAMLLDYMARTKCRHSRLDAYKSRSLYRSDGHWVFADKLSGMARRVRVPTLILWANPTRFSVTKTHPVFAVIFRRHALF